MLRLDLCDVVFIENMQNNGKMIMIRYMYISNVMHLT